MYIKNKLKTNLLTIKTFITFWINCLQTKSKVIFTAKLIPKAVHIFADRYLFGRSSPQKSVSADPKDARALVFDLHYRSSDKRSA